MKVEWHPKARAELEDAKSWYETRRADLIERVVTILEHLSEAHVHSRPVPYVNEALGAKRIVVRGFRYSVIYIDRGERRVVLAFAHHSRRPGYWRARLVR